MPSLFQFSPANKEPQSPRSRLSSAVPTGAPPPPLPPHRLSRKPPRLSMGFYKTNSTTSLDSPPSTATRMRKRLSSFLLSSPIIRHSDSRLSLKHGQGVEAAAEDDIDRDDITTPPTSASDDLFLSPTALDDDENPPPTAAVTNSTTALSLAELVRRELGTVVQDVDEEIDQAWEDSRRVLRQSLLVRAAQRPTVY